jgi:hypothetical protein
VGEPGVLVLVGENPRSELHQPGRGRRDGLDDAVTCPSSRADPHSEEQVYCADGRIVRELAPHVVFGFLHRDSVARTRGMALIRVG